MAHLTRYEYTRHLNITDARCYFCNQPVKIPNTNHKGRRKSSMHHLKHKVYGGTDDIHNLAICCNRCHRDYHRFFHHLTLGHQYESRFVRCIMKNLAAHKWYCLRKKVNTMLRLNGETFWDQHPIQWVALTTLIGTLALL